MIGVVAAQANGVSEDPDSEQARLLYASAREEFDATQAMLVRPTRVLPSVDLTSTPEQNAACMGKLTDEADQRLLLAQAKAVAAAMAEMLRLTESATSALPDATKKGVVGKVRGSRRWWRRR